VAFTGTPITCPGDNNGSLSVTTVSGGPYTYAWSHDPNLIGAAAFNLAPGPYQVTVTDALGCIAVFDTLLEEPYVAPLGTITSTNLSCAGASDGTVTFDLNDGPYQWTWAHAPGVTTTTLTGLAPGFYAAVITGGPPPCPSIVGAWLGDPAVTIQGETDYCPAAPPLLSAQLDWGFQPDYIAWSTGDTASTYQVPAGLSGVVSIVAEDTTIGCVVNAQITLTELPAPFVAFAAPDSACMNAAFVVNTTATDADSLVWEWGNLGFSNEPDPTVSFPEPLWQPISLTGYDSLGCGGYAQEDSVFIVAQIPAIYTVEQIPCTPMVDILLGSESDSCAFFIGDSLVTYDCDGFIRWDFGRYDDYAFTFYSTHPEGCDDTLAVTVDVRTEPVLFLANAFTPNDDGINDYWPVRTDIPELGFELMLFDRWGQSLWATTDPLEQWDGAGLPMGVYVYTMKMRDPCSATNEIVKSGHVTLFR
jgi:gliding motility-associated-like protein